ncbi:hypothetical protein SAMN04487965_2044 [Microbulbifer donghaiensis]|uniref:DUF4410 domain-containing protein n=1 Tax=Microbulbifer donghaiensis TaxID=494016 RepID=A0A1M5B261_9GAMM|nr:hypothetical protein [Microbulbifer donghaiensis]SHF36545.1 hypothetical protein SAMN04487965_2044 [Microbulbifer donghaiensis]
MQTAKAALFLAGALLSASTLAQDDAAISINQKAEYYDTKVIAPNIVRECTNLGYKFSDSTKKFLEKYGFSAALQPEQDLQTEGFNLKLSILNATSSGNAWSGHRKSVTIEAELYKDGELIDSFQNARNSSGGFGGGFKGSCDVLERCVHTLGNDVAKWIKKKHQG